MKFYKLKKLTVKNCPKFNLNDETITYFVKKQTKVLILEHSSLPYRFKTKPYYNDYVNINIKKIEEKKVIYNPISETDVDQELFMKKGKKGRAVKVDLGNTYIPTKDNGDYNTTVDNFGYINSSLAQLLLDLEKA